MATFNEIRAPSSTKCVAEQGIVKVLFPGSEDAPLTQ